MVRYEKANAEDEKNIEESLYDIQYMKEDEIQIRNSQDIVFRKGDKEYHLAAFETNYSAEEWFKMAKEIIK